MNEQSSKIHKIANKILFGCKVAITEIAQPFLWVCAAVETLAYGILGIKSYAQGNKDKQQYYFQLIESSAFTALTWVPLVSFCNFLRLNVEPDECKTKKDLTEKLLTTIFVLGLKLKSFINK